MKPVVTLKSSAYVYISSSTNGEFMSMEPMISTRGFEPTTLNAKNSGQVLESLIMEYLIIILAPVGLAGNAVVLWFLGFQMQKNAFTTYILNLAGADFLYLFCHFIFSLQLIIDISSSITFYIPGILNTILISTYIAGLSILSAISTERCLSVLFPIWHRCHRKSHMSALICALIWAWSFLMTILWEKYCWHYVWCQNCGFIIVAWMIISCLFLFVSNMILSVRLFCVFKRKQMTRLCVTIGLTVLVFLFCGLPWSVHIFLLYWIEGVSDKIKRKLDQPGYLLTCVNSCANPIIYFLVGSFRQQRQQRRQNLKLVLRRAFEDVPS